MAAKTTRRPSCSTRTGAGCTKTAARPTATRATRGTRRCVRTPRRAPQAVLWTARTTRARTASRLKPTA
uniref:Uncharacterized protein n=1 Tax=Hyaloperonospora arabidopsidis (strain Emoy2) TaxID=559515 RepID=M4BUX2_HYAAE